MKNPIEFQPSNSTTTADLIARWPQPKPPFEDRIPKTEFVDIKGTLPKGVSTVRILPPLNPDWRSRSWHLHNLRAYLAARVLPRMDRNLYHTYRSRMPQYIPERPNPVFCLTFT